MHPFRVIWLEFFAAFTTRARLVRESAAHGIQETVLEIRDQIDQNDGEDVQKSLHVTSAFAKGDVDGANYEKYNRNEGDDRENVEPDAVFFSKRTKQRLEHVHLYNVSRFCY